MTLVPSFFNN